jgi:NitT/TauT family transport system ATP-binding protein
MRFRQQLEDYMSEDYADETLRAVVAWARYAELFAFDDKADMFSLENPE